MAKRYLVLCLEPFDSSVTVNTVLYSGQRELCTPLDEQGVDGRRKTQSSPTRESTFPFGTGQAVPSAVHLAGSLQGPRHCFALVAAKLETEIRANATLLLTSVSALETNGRQ